MSSYLSKISNVIGTPIFDYAKAELNRRVKYNTKETRDDTNVVYLANKSAWVRLVSSVNIEDRAAQLLDQIGLSNKKDDQLAKDFVLFGGVSKFDKNATLRYGMVGTDTAYNIAGQRELSDYGPRPMPGITSVNIDTHGRLGSIRYATINFKVGDKYQMDIIEALYFRLGYSMLLEWGNTMYYDETDQLVSSEKYMIDIFNKTYGYNGNKHAIYSTIASNIRESSGNYDGMLGIVTNFNFSFNQDGTYDCTIKLSAPGILAEDTKIDNATTLNDLYIQLIEDTLKSKKDEEEAKAKFFRAAEVAIEADKIRVSFKNDAWVSSTAQGIDEPELANLIYKQQPEWFKSAINGTRVETVKTNTKADPRVPESGYIEEDIQLPKSYDPKKINELVRKFKTQNILEQTLQDSRGNPTVKSYSAEGVVEAYSIPGESGDVIYYERTLSIQPNILLSGSFTQIDTSIKKYIKADEDIKVTLDVDLINKIITERDPKKLEILGGAKTQINQSPNKDLTFVDVLVKDSISLKPTSGEILYNYNGIGNFYLSISYNLAENFNSAKKTLTNPNTKYLVKKVDATRSFFSPNYYIKLESDEGYIIQIGGPGKNRIPDLSFIKTIEGNQPLLEPNPLTQQLTALEQRTAQELQATLNQIDTNYNANTEYYKDVKNRSAIELMLKGIELYAQQKDIDSSGVAVFSLAGEDEIYKRLFTGGIYTNIIETLVTTPYSQLNQIAQNNVLNYKDLNAPTALKTNTIFGNNHNLLGGLLTLEGALNAPTVNFKDMMKVWSLPYGKPNEQNAATKKYYITFGMLIMMLNHVSLLYDFDGNTATPMYYIDFNTYTNLMLSTGQHMSVDTNKFLVPFDGSIGSYAALFDDAILDSSKTTILGSGSIQEHPIWDPTYDNVSTILPDFRSVDIDANGNTVASTSSYYQGKIMNVLISTEYASDLIKQFYQASGNSNSAYVKAYIDRILQDMVESMGGFNSLRLAYVDVANCFVIVDDQLQKSLPGEGSLYADSDPYKYSIPLFGAGSLATSVSLKTNISTRINNIIAISANQKDQTQKSINGEDFGWMNKGYKDRFIGERVDTTQIQSGSQDTSNIQLKLSAMGFDDTIRAIYLNAGRLYTDASSGEVEYMTSDMIDHAKNYYMNKLSIVKSRQPGSVATFSIPVSLDFTMDGMSAIYPMQAFVADENILPYSYRSTANGYPIFGVGKITHQIESNRWTTSYSTYMMRMRKNEGDYEAPVKLLDKKVKIAVPQQYTYSAVPFNLGDQLKNVRIAVNFFRGKGYNDFAIAALIGGFIFESNMNPNAKNQIGAIGIAQWLDRKDKLIANGPGYQTLQRQLNFVITELTSTENFSGTKLRAATTIEQAIAAAALYERFADISNINKQTKSYEKTYDIVVDRLINKQIATKNAPLEWGNRIGYTLQLLEDIKTGKYAFNPNRPFDLI